MKKLYYYYDKGADVLYFSQGEASAKDLVQETNDDVVLRIDHRTKKIRGFTILNFTKRMKGKSLPISLPINANLTPA